MYIYKTIQNKCSVEIDGTYFRVYEVDFSFNEDNTKVKIESKGVVIQDFTLINTVVKCPEGSCFTDYNDLLTTIGYTPVEN